MGGDGWLEAGGDVITFHPSPSWPFEATPRTSHSTTVVVPYGSQSLQRARMKVRGRQFIIRLNRAKRILDSWEPSELQSTNGKEGRERRKSWSADGAFTTASRLLPSALTYGLDRYALILGLKPISIVVRSFFWCVFYKKVAVLVVAVRQWLCLVRLPRPTKLHACTCASSFSQFNPLPSLTLNPATSSPLRALLFRRY